MGHHDYQLAKLIAESILEGDKEIIMPDGKTIILPSPQKRGTDYQKQSRANRAAIELIEQWQKNKN